MIITVDTGGTKTLVAAADTAGRFHTRYRFATPKEPAKYIDQLSEVILNHFDIKKIRAISIAIPGPIKNHKVVFCPNIDKSWKDFDVIGDLRARLGIKNPIYLQNDSNMAGLAEAHAIDPIPKSCLYITISTGIGIAAVQNGKINPSLQLSEGAHMILEYDGILRQWEHFASGRSIYETYGKFARDIHAKSVWEQIADKISRGFLVIIPLLQPHTIIIGGSIGTYYDRYAKILSAILDERLEGYLVRPHIIQAKHPEEAVIYGCKIYAEQKLAK